MKEVKPLKFFEQGSNEPMQTLEEGNNYFLCSFEEGVEKIEPTPEHEDPFTAVQVYKIMAIRNGHRSRLNLRPKSQDFDQKYRDLLDF